jgi:ABC-type branched-subunit amino acid transport system substrate-binding protein
MPRRVLGRTRAVSLCACAALFGLAGCTSSSARNSQITISGAALTVYASQPPGNSGGPAVQDTLAAEKLALTEAGGRAGKFTIKLVTLHGKKLSDNARTAIQNQTAIAYLGELQPGTSQISVEILNQQGVLEVSPADTAVYLTQSTPAVPGSPGTFYPTRSTYRETFARVVPNAAQEAKAQVQMMQAEHVATLFVASDGQPYGAAAALEIERAARQAGIAVKTGAPSAAAVKTSGADGLLYAATDDSPSARTAAVTLLDGLASALPSLKLFAPSGLYDADFASALGQAAAGRLIVSSPGFLPPDLPPAGSQFASAFKAAYGHVPATQAIFGYEAMKALLSVISNAGASGSSRAAIVAEFRSLKNPPPVIGTFSINGGDPNVAPFVFARVRGGRLVPFKFVQG